MLQFETNKGIATCDGLTRRDFLRVGALSAGAAALGDLARLQGGNGSNGDVRCILLFLVGGPSQIDTWDPKPAAPARVRGPFRPIATNVPGLRVAETFPLLARRADRVAVVRSVHHAEAPIHETGQQLMQTGRLSRDGHEAPHYGAVLSQRRGPTRPGAPPWVVLPAPIGNTGVGIGHGQTAGALGAEHEAVVVRGDVLDPARIDGGRPLVDAADLVEKISQNALFASSALDLAAESDSLRDAYGRTTFGQSCLLARRLVEHGVRLVTVNMFDTVFDRITWDCHADGGALPTTLDDYRDILCPMFDRAYAALLDDLEGRGLLDTTLVLATGEFGRTPTINPRGGRDHWPGCWSVLFAGGGVRGGQVVGASDATASEPKDRPVSAPEVAATVYRALGVDDADVGAAPVSELLTRP